jgi:hypothetical protein
MTTVGKPDFSSALPVTVAPCYAAKPMKKDTRPATKGDVKDIHNKMSSMEKRLDKKMDTLEKHMENKMDTLEKHMYVQMDKRQAELMRYFNVVAENIHHDAIGANTDEIEVIKDRVTRLERHTGLATAA